jgi:hypothetical protein
MRPTSLFFPPSRRARIARVAGITLILATLLEVLVIAHHPGMSLREMVQGSAAAENVGTFGEWVHGTLMVLVVAVYFGLTEFAVQQDLRRPFVRLGLIAYSLGLLAMLGAALLNGFVTWRALMTIGRLAAAGTLQEPTVFRQLLILASVLSQSLADVGGIAMSTGVVLWSISILWGTRYERVVGAGGVLVGVASAIALGTGTLVLDQHGILALAIFEALWTVCIGVLLLQRHPLMTGTLLQD